MMLSQAELESLLVDAESDRVERKSSLANTDRIREAICAFANDLPSHGKPGIVFVGVNDDGNCANLAITDELLLTLADMRSDGQILPIPTMYVQKCTLRGCTMAVIVVEPSFAPPVRYRGRVWIRVGPRRAIASADEERRLNEKRRSQDRSFDLHILAEATIDDLDLDGAWREYLQSAVAPDVLADNQRDIEQQLASLRFIESTEPYRPTVSGVLVVGKQPLDFLPGAFVQFLRFNGVYPTDPIADQHVITGALSQLLRRVDDVLRANIRIATDITTADLEVQRPDYPLVAIQQIVRNAIMHRDYETTNAPVRIYWYADRIEVQNPGGPFGQVTIENFGSPGITDYRNPHVAEAMRNLGYIQRFGVGIALARKLLVENGNPQLDFDIQPNHVLVSIRSRP
ncbi:MAG: putative DNA binding domain-containing protein [Pirellulales bacterium]|nr:putative DNA binding domain-containing protein [Pirellulales bacterium]